MGALTLKTFSDEVREWEFIEGEGIDPTDGFGTSLRLSIRENQIFLAEPNDPDMPWLTDRGRLFFDGMFEESHSDLDWQEFFRKVMDSLYFTDHLNYLKKSSIFSLLFIFENLSLETLNILYLLGRQSSLIQLRRAEASSNKNDLESFYQLNSSSRKHNLNKSTLGLLINTNVRYEGYVLNLSLRQRLLKGNFKLFVLNSIVDLTFPVYNLGSNMNILRSIGEGTNLSCQDFKNAEFPLLISNSETMRRNDAKEIFKILKRVVLMNGAWNALNTLNPNLGATGMNSLSNFLPVNSEDFSNFFGLYFINISVSAVSNLKQLTELELLDLTVPNRLKANSNIISQNNTNLSKEFCLQFNENDLSRYYYLPNNLFLEDSETFINTQGLIKRVTKTIHFKKEAKTNWQILRKLYAKVKKLVVLTNKKDNVLIHYNCNNLFSFKNFMHFQFQTSKSLTSMGSFLTKRAKPLNYLAVSQPIKSKRVKIFNTKLKNWLDDFFNTAGKDFYSYNSSALINCSKIQRANMTNFF